MSNSLKVAKWEIKRNMKNKSFLISLFITPIIFLLFAFVPTWLEKFEDKSEPVKVWVNDELQVFSELEKMVSSQNLDWKLEKTDKTEEAILDELKEAENAVYIPLTQKALSEGIVQIYESDEVDPSFMQQVQILGAFLQQLQFYQLNLSEEQIALITKGITFKEVSVSSSSETSDAEEEQSIEKIAPGIFAGIILFSIVVSGMMIFQSASQEKKEKVAEIILSSVTPEDLMKGKIIGYFVLGIVQVFVLLIFLIPLAIWKFEIPLIKYLLVPELLLYLLIAIAGYLLFAAIFVGIGATVSDLDSAGNFQGIVMMLPFLPLFIISPVISNPSGTIAQIATYFPLTSPAIMLVRLSILDEWPWIEIMISLVILALTIWLFMKLAGKIFKTGILLYGKNATPKEIWKWIRQ